MNSHFNNRRKHRVKSRFLEFHSENITEHRQGLRRSIVKTLKKIHVDTHYLYNLR